MQHLTDGAVELAPEFTLAYQAWLPEGVKSLEEAAPDRRILSWPGWLDNSGSMEPIAPFFVKKGFAVAAFDPPGCGRSSHHANCAWYHDFEEAHYIMMLADRLGWGAEPFILMSHSRGSNISAFTAAAFPHRVRAVILFESSLGMAGTYITNRRETGPIWGSFSESIAMDRKNRTRTPRKFEEFEEAVQHNVGNPAFPKSREIGQAIVLRHLISHPEGGLTFGHDVRTYGQNQSRFIDEETNVAFLRALRAPVINIYGSQTSMSELVKYSTDEESAEAYQKTYNWHAVPSSVFLPYVRDVRKRTATVKDFTPVIIEDAHHHLHGDVPEEVASAVLPWLEDRLRQPLDTKPPIDLRGAAGDVWMSASAQHMLSPSTASAESAALSEVTSNEGSANEANGAAEIIAENIEVEVDGLRLGAQRWGKASSMNRVLAWPDAWDSSGSFQQLAQRAVAASPNGDLCVVAVDPPGIGLSNNAPFDWGFGMSETATLLLRVADALGWEDPFALWGHGFGATVALYAAGGLPSKISGVVAFDAQELTIPTEWAPAEVYYSYLERQDEPRAVPRFARREELISRLQTDPNFPKSSVTANAIASRMAESDADGSAWTLNVDARVFRVRKPVLETPGATFQDILAGIEAPVLAVFPVSSARATNGPPSQRKRLFADLACIRSPLTTIHVNGSSHAHSCDAAHMLPVVRDWVIQLMSVRRMNLASPSALSQDSVSKL
ncbi:Serine hydrolase-like protein [Hondaea fermentalgiana]|uniref:Serine hydrolase-like protein n=1 Tax=Hondaea fermentalgiana TaxID=2315210 RepID=A0A2R5GHS9_9STRA|nr:Serine hydrolase-like protein [Hondaea fermentalgiana]|eukprot:GBG30145.1 Serine hydrolase-like protein [Hondaea fermentalgiana]